MSRPYIETYFEQASNRETGKRAPGARSVSSSVQYKVNGATDVKRYDYTGGTIVQNGHYAAGTITDIQTTDEQGHEIHEYTNKTDQLICRYQVATGYTYYVYDDLGLLRGVLQPNFQDDNSLANSAYLYDYDERNRVIKKQIPGAGNAAPGIIELVYDKFDRQVLSRDANQKARSVWGFIKYDALNRAVITGEIASTDDRAAWVTAVNAITEHHEIRDDAVTEGYTLDKTVPTTATLANLLTITFYDNYAFSTPSGLGFTTLYYAANNANVKGLPTGGRVKMLPGDSGTPESWLTNVTYYDAEYRPIQTVRQLFDLGASAVERVSILYKYDLAAVIAEQKTEQTVSTGTNSLLAVYSYDHNDQLLGVRETVGVGSKTKTAYTLAQRYNTLGQLQSKWFHAYSTNDSKYRVKTNHTNNIRGWLTGAESLYQKKIGEPELPYYAFSLAYANGAVPASSNYTNGNISQMKWSGKDESTLTKGLNFEYDDADRLTGSTGLSSYADTEGGITYDKNGNIKTLHRAGVAVDNLTYSYNGNQLSGVNDASGNNTGVKNGGSNYSYDDNGNMTSDGNRGASISYNYLNLPKKVTIGSRNLVYDYDASGPKHKYYDLTAPDTVNIKYAGIFEYDGNNDLKRVITSSGQVQRAKVLPSPASDTLRFDYFLKDHLGNVRVVFDESGKILQRSDYYPYGLSISRDGALPANARNGINRYNFLSKETQIATGYIDLQARFYDPLTARFNTVDPLTEKGRRWNPYSYGFDNPMRFADPDGMWPWDALVSAFKKWYNTPLNKSQQKVSRAASIGDFPAQTQGEVYKNALLTGLIHASSGVQPGSFRRPANMYKQVAKAGDVPNLPPRVIDDVPDATGFGPKADPIRIQGPWTQGDLVRAANGQGPLDFIPMTNRAGRKMPLELHHGDQMPGSAVHEVPPAHSGSVPHPNRFNQGVTPLMRTQDSQLHWYLRGLEMENK